MTPRKPVTDWATDWDHLDPRWREDPFPIWDELRQSCPIAHTERYQGAYLPTRYEDVRAIAHGARVAKTIEHKQLGRERLAAIVTLAFVGVDADPHRFLRPSGNVSSLSDPSRYRSSF